MIWDIAFWTGLAIVAASYGGYALWVALLARLRPAPPRVAYDPDDRLPTVTCVMAAANEGGLIERKLAMLAEQDYPADKLAIIVVSDASTDDTERIVAERAAWDPRIRLLRTPARSGKPTALNLARSRITSEIAIFMDVRQRLTPNAIRELVAHLADSRVGAVSGDYRLQGDAYWAYERFVRRCESRSGSMVQVTGSLYAIRTADFPTLPPDIILDDVYVPLTVALSGRRIVMAEEAGSTDAATRSIGSEFMRKVRTLAGLVQLCHALPGCLSPARNPLWGRFLAHKLSRLACPYALLLILAGAVMTPGWLPRSALAAAGGMVLLTLAPSLGIRSRLASASRSILALNLAALWAIPSYYLGRVSVLWARVETNRT